MIKIWPYNEAPNKYKCLSTNGGDEDWIVLLPFKLSDSDFIIPLWLYRIDTCDKPQIIEIDEGTIFIGSHS